MPSPSRPLTLRKPLRKPLRIPLQKPLRIFWAAILIVVAMGWNVSATAQQNKSTTPTPAPQPASAQTDSKANSDDFAIPPLASDSIRATIESLINQLGDENYLVRQNSATRLKRFGLEAFDQLHAAQFHPDLEIESAAKYLVGSLMVNWAKQDDPREVREALDEYGNQTEIERQSRIDILSGLPDRRGLEALLRLTRFETSLRLSEVAALAIMNQPSASSKDENLIDVELIEKQLSGNERRGSQWLRVYASDLKNGEYSAAKWQELIQRQRREVDSGSNQKSTRQSILDLVRICATHASRMNRRQEAIDLTNAHLDLIPPTTSQIVEAATWAIDNNLHPVVLSLRDNFSQFFQKQPLLLYIAAAALLDADRKSDAEALAKEASQHPPLPDAEAKKKMSPKSIQDVFQERRQIAMDLQTRGFFEWSQREYEQIIAHADFEEDASISAREQLAFMWTENREFQKVVDILQPLADRFEQDDELKMRYIQDRVAGIGRVVSDLNFAKAELAFEKNNDDEGRTLLMAAYRAYEANIDILIRLYRTDGDQQWRGEVMQELQGSISECTMEVRREEMQAKEFGSVYNARLASVYNQYAWLVANTEGDQTLALQYSLESLKLDSDGAKMDTCARCYFALKRYDQAIAMQKRAIKLMPHSPPLERQLLEIEKARKQQLDQSETTNESATTDKSSSKSENVSPK
jgi:tetratricopeptide (TPR) repeat protein